LNERIQNIAKKTVVLSARDRPRVACIEWVEPLMLAGNWTPQLIELAGGQSLLAPAEKHSTYCEWSDLAAADPEILIISPCGFDLPRSLKEAEALSRRGEWDGLTAVKNRRVVVIDGNAYLNRSGPRIVDSLEILAHVIQPQRFTEPSHEGWLNIG
jgi:iron complex transport system substrate-binding protein